MPLEVRSDMPVAPVGSHVVEDARDMFGDLVDAVWSRLWLLTLRFY